ncbi:sucrase ferredoxin [Nocardioides sp. AE5]|uniref:sucrase ferredoxin n=1 Tax=Nocardioides sp. AE5 TaxID=2962573 RepID=UPI002881A207|nr:sucrase ferredoxin [Nocardioides sp. AE5]MDT0203503.1 sucrase ferredoxin [Nocardioides sp. AE5]
MGEPAVDTNRYRCVLGAADEPLPGTSAHDTAYLLIEHPGPWGHKALAESRLPAEVRDGLAAASADTGVRIQLIRRHGRTTQGGPFRIFLAYAEPGTEWIRTGLLDVAEDLLDLDLDALAAGGSEAAGVGLDEHIDPLLLVCTNGRRDACCAEFGRPVAAALAAAHPEQTWETSHLGGHRFAGAMLTLPHGLSYGRLDVGNAYEVAEATLEGRIDLSHLRGRAAWPPEVQAAEIALRTELADTAADGLELVEAVALADGTRVRFRHRSAGVREVDVRVEAGPTLRASCADTMLKATRRYAATVAP